MSHGRLDPSEIAPEELDDLSGVLTRPGRASLIDAEGNRVDLPAPIVEHLIRVVRLMAERRTVVLIPEDEPFTTQAAADYLGVSRQHLVDLLERGEIPFHRVGTHRRVTFRDLRSYADRRDEKRRTAIDELMDEVEEAHLYDGSYTGDDE